MGLYDPRPRPTRAPLILPSVIITPQNKFRLHLVQFCFQAISYISVSESENEMDFWVAEPDGQNQIDQTYCADPNLHISFGLYGVLIYVWTLGLVSRCLTRSS